MISGRNIGLSLAICASLTACPQEESADKKDAGDANSSKATDAGHQSKDGSLNGDASLGRDASAECGGAASPPIDCPNCVHRLFSMRGLSIVDGACTCGEPVSMCLWVESMGNQAAPGLLVDRESKNVWVFSSKPGSTPIGYAECGGNENTLKDPPPECDCEPARPAT